MLLGSAKSRSSASTFLSPQKGQYFRASITLTGMEPEWRRARRGLVIVQLQPGCVVGGRGGGGQREAFARKVIKIQLTRQF